MLAAGILLLLAGLILAMTVGTFAVPVLLSSSIIVNSAGILMLRHRKK